jgi:flagella basal body P-ring formation protein FlgA
MMGRAIFTVFCAALLLGGNARAMDASTLRGAVLNYLQGQAGSLRARAGGEGRVQFAIVGIDPRFHAPDCAQPPQFSIAENSGLGSRLNVRVTCNSGNGWSVYVPVDVAIHRPVVAAARPLPRDAAITAADLQLLERDVASLNGQFLTAIDEAVGLSARRPLAAGAVLSRDQLLQPLLIRRGDAVTIRVESGGLSVNMPGVAMTDGRRGEPIRVKNSNSARIVDAQVVEAGVVTVPM